MGTDETVITITKELREEFKIFLLHHWKDNPKWLGAHNMIRNFVASKNLKYYPIYKTELGHAFARFTRQLNEKGLIKKHSKAVWLIL